MANQPPAEASADRISELTKRLIDRSWAWITVEGDRFTNEELDEGIVKAAEAIRCERLRRSSIEMHVNGFTKDEGDRGWRHLLGTEGVREIATRVLAALDAEAAS